MLGGTDVLYERGAGSYGGFTSQGQAVLAEEAGCTYLKFIPGARLLPCEYYQVHQAVYGGDGLMGIDTSIR